jgi:hypothetical protein
MADRTQQELDVMRAACESHTFGVAPTFPWNPNAPRGGIILKEFLTEYERLCFMQRGELPAVRGPCIVCIRVECEYNRFLNEIKVTNTHNMPHYHTVDVPGGYRSDACIQWSRSGKTHGTLSYIRAFDTAQYIPVSFAVACASDCIGLFDTEDALLRSGAAKYPRGAHANGYPDARGYLEDGSVFYFHATRWMSPQAASLGAEPAATYVPLLKELPLPPGLQMLARPLAIKAAPGATVDILRQFSWATTEAAMCLGYDITAVHVLLGPFAPACVAIKWCLLVDKGAIQATNMDTIPDSLKFSSDPLLTARHIVTIVKAQHHWGRFVIPAQPHSCAVAAAAFARSSICEDIKRVVAVDIVNNAHYGTLKSKAAAEADGRSTHGPDTIFARMTAHQADIISTAMRTLDISTAPKCSSFTAEDTALRKRDGTFHQNRMPLSHLNNLVAVFSRMWLSHRPLIRWLVAACASHRTVADRDVIGAKFDECAMQMGQSTNSSAEHQCIISATTGLGDVNPDVAFQPFSSAAHKAMAATGVDTSKQATAADTHSRVDVPIYVPPPPAVARLRFPTHREAIVTWLQTERSGQAYFGRTVFIAQPICIALRALDLITDNDLNGPHNKVLSSVTLGDILREFWECAWVLQQNSGADHALIELLQPHLAECIPDGLQCDNVAGATDTPHAFATSLIVRVCLANQLQLYAQTMSVALRVQSFGLTHTDLALAIQWGRDGTVTTDAELTKATTLQSPADVTEANSLQAPPTQQRAPKTATSLLELAYPRDTRCTEESAKPSLAALLPHCGLFEPSNPTLARTSTHAMGKPIPRACQSREANSVTLQVCFENRAYARFVAKATEDMLCGRVGHATVRPNFATCLAAKQIVNTAEHTLYVRADAMAMKDAHEQHHEGLTTIVNTVSLFTEKCGLPSGGCANEVVNTVITMQQVFASVADAIVHSVGEEIVMPFRDAANTISSIVCDAIVLELYRQLLSRTAPPATRRLFISDAMVAAWDTVALDTNTRTPPYHDATVGRMRAVIRTHITQNLNQYQLFRRAMDSEGATTALMTTFVTDLCASIEPIKTNHKPVAPPPIRPQTPEHVKCIKHVVDALTRTFTVLNSSGLCGVDLVDVPTHHVAVQVAVREALVAYYSALTRLHIPNAAVAKTAPGGRAELSTMLTAELSKLRVVGQTPLPVQFQEIMVGDDMTRPAVKMAVHRACMNFSAHRIPQVYCSTVAERVAEDTVTFVGRAVANGLLNNVLLSIVESVPLILHVVDIAAGALDANQRSVAIGVASLVPDGSKLARCVIGETMRMLFDGMAADDPAKLPPTWMCYMANAELARIKNVTTGRRDMALFRAVKDVCPAVGDKSISPGLMTAPPPNVVHTYSKLMPRSPEWWAKHRERDADTTAVLHKLDKVAGSNRLTNKAGAGVWLRLFADDATKLMRQTIIDAAQLAARVTDYANATKVCIANRKDAATYGPNSVQSATKLFVESNPTLINYVMREAVVTAISRNTPLFRAFVTCGGWFTDFMKHVCQVCDHIRWVLVTKGCLPTERELSVFAADVRKTTWGNHVFRLYKHREPVRLAKTFAKIEADLRSKGTFVNQHHDALSHTAAANRRRLMWEYLIAEHAAHRLEPGHEYTRDLETLWRFGMREHGLGIVAQLINAYETFGGSNELTKIVSNFFASEFELAATYYDLASIAENADVLPLHSRLFAETSLAALAVRHCIRDGKSIPVELTQLYVCDSCKSVVTQLAPRTIRHMDVSSAFGASSDFDGRVVCADRKNLSRRRIGAILGTGAAKAALDDSAMLLMDDAVIPDEIRAHSDTEGPGTVKLKRRRRKHKTHRSIMASLMNNGEPPPPSIFTWMSSCNKTRLRTFPLLGAAVEFDTKYSSLSEKSCVAKLPCIISPCCGQITRFVCDSIDERGIYECLTCAATRGAPRFTSPLCAACGCETRSSVLPSVLDGMSLSSATPAANRAVIGMEMAGMVKPIPSSATKDLFQTKTRHVCTTYHNRTLATSTQTSTKFGNLMPITATSTALVFDDILTFSVIPVDLCDTCAWAPSVRRGEWPVLLSKIAEYTYNKREEARLRSMLFSSSVSQPTTAFVRKFFDIPRVAQTIF